MLRVAPKFDQQKFRELILYIAAKSGDDPRFGAVKLNKILYFSDFIAFRKLGHSITGATYRKLNEGPVPREMLSTRTLMLDTNEVTIEYRQYFNGVQQRIVPLREPNTDIFAQAELDIVNEAITELWSMNARQTSDYSHMEIGWKAARTGEDIPYETAWLSPDPIPQEAEEYWHEVKERFA